MQAIKAIETSFKGYKFRSRLEARWAVFFDAIGCKWEYEKEGYDLPSGPYLPDFYLPELDWFIEIKPPQEVPYYGMYLAGKIRPDWREQLDIHGHFSSGPNINKAHNAGLHGENVDLGESEVLSECLSAINDSTCLFAWIDSLDAFGTIAEIGYARGRKIPILVGVDESLEEELNENADNHYGPDDGNHSPVGDHDLWFIEALADKFGFFPSPQAAADHWFGDLSPEEKKCRDLSRQGSDVLLMHGDPVEAAYSFQFSNGLAATRRYRHWVWFQFIGRKRGWCLDQKNIDAACIKARSARFEHGVCG